MKITLDTLAKATPQEVLDQVRDHLLTQLERSVDYTSRCQYRMGTLSCAAGCLIGDDEYKAEWEGRGWCELAETRQVPSVHQALISALQLVHDEMPVFTWAQQLEEVAARFLLV